MQLPKSFRNFRLKRDAQPTAAPQPPEPAAVQGTSPRTAPANNKGQRVKALMNARKAESVQEPKAEAPATVLSAQEVTELYDLTRQLMGELASAMHQLWPGALQGRTRVADAAGYVGKANELLTKATPLLVGLGEARKKGEGAKLSEASADLIDAMQQLTEEIRQK